MDNLTEALEEYNNTVQAWKETPFDDISQTSELMKDLVIIKDFLVKEKIGYKKSWSSKWFKYHSSKEKGGYGMSSTAAEKLASHNVPELDQLRQIIRSGNDMIDIMRSQVSLLKESLR